MADRANNIVKLCDSLCATDQEKLSCLSDALATIRARLGISSAKADGGTTGESWIAHHFDLRWQCEKKTGVDALDADGRACEIKASLHPPKTKPANKINISYSTPRRARDEEADAFVERTKQHVAANTGGHFWATWVEKTPADAGDRILLRWWVPSEPLALLIAKKMRASSHMETRSVSISINFGAVICRECGGAHRVDNIVKALGGWNGRTDTAESLAIVRARDTYDMPSDAELSAADPGTTASQCTKEP